MRVRVLSWWLPLLTLAGVAGCAPKVQEQYDVQIFGPVDRDYLAKATTASLEFNDVEIAHTSVSPGVFFELKATGIDPRVSGAGIFRVRARDATNTVVAQGETPVIEVLLATPPEPYQIFVQEPGSLGRARDLEIGRRGLIAAPVVAKKGSGATVSDVTVALFGLGSTPMSGQPDLPTGDLRVYSPITHYIGAPMLTGSAIGMHVARSDAAAVARADGSIAVFGGISPTATGILPTAALEIFTASRDDFDAFGVQADIVRNTMAPGFARSRTTLVDTNQLLYAFGGQTVGGMALDSIVAMNPTADNSFTLLPVHMAGPRIGHTATSFLVGGLTEVLVFGGAAAGVPVAEVFVPSGPTPQFVAPTGDAGQPRRDHVALALPAMDASVLIIGGADLADVPLGDSLFYLAKTRSFSPGPIKLQFPRRSCTAFIINHDLVVTGGTDAQGSLIPTAEVFTIDASGTRPKALIPAYPRVGAVSAQLSNHSVVLMGGTDISGASPVVEIYQPND